MAMNGGSPQQQQQQPAQPSTGPPAPGLATGLFKEELDDFERFALENLVSNEWGLKTATIKRLIYCGVSVECLEVIEERDLNDIFNDERMIGQKVLLRHRLREWRKGLHWNCPPSPDNKRRAGRRSIDHNNEPTVKKIRLTPTIKLMQQHNSNHGNNHNNMLEHITSSPAISIIPEARTNSSQSAAAVVPSSSANHNNTSASNRHSNGSSEDAGNLPIRITPDALSIYLQSSRSGRWVLAHYNEQQELDKKALTLLTHIVVEPFLIYNITFTHSMMRHYAEVICKLFPSEQMETFYCPRNTIRKNPTGKLYDRYVNQRLRYKTKYNVPKPTMVEESQLHRSFAEMSDIGDTVLNQQYLDYAGEQLQQLQQHQQSLLAAAANGGGNMFGTPSQMDSFSEESMNLYGAE
ncbi:uncharacterized protein LOC129750625 [Uranotaenia lowii]|uniref:uncharacterized protein LOC129750625 n=1 Tax=Uranotaenia lowii TaxID=190385 RepID=UPI00247AB123|nr:uncharacterized protein LOC129750625 [Uranotaenia lowii]XP_055601595.1 uncharacterized protein LOC129750625 [Uranotaenia lowii]